MKTVKEKNLNVEMNYAVGNEGGYMAIFEYKEDAEMFKEFLDKNFPAWEWKVVKIEKKEK
jgi:hypothetical protein